MVARNSRKPGDEIVDRRATLKVLEKRADRNAGVLEYPRTAYLTGESLNGGAVIPLSHANSLISAANDAIIQYENRPFANNAESVDDRIRGVDNAILHRPLDIGSVLDVVERV